MKNGFTLAEVLITLGVIGVVSAMILPSVIQNYQKQRTVSKLKKVYTVLNQAFKISETENDSFKNWSKIVDEVTREEYAKKYFIPYLKVIKTCDDIRQCGYKSTTPFKSLNNNHITYPQSGIILNDGTYIGFTKAMNSPTLFVDINGIAGPNKYGRDVFMLHATSKGVTASGYSIDNTIWCSKSHTGGDSGEQCAGKIMHDGWKIKDDYPW